MGFNFEHLPATPLVGANNRTFNRVISNKAIDNRHKYLLTKSCQRILAPLYALNSRGYKTMAKPKITSPLFIIGHWRSGTTMIHNTLSLDPQFGYCTTYQTIFPHLMLYGSRLFRQIASLCMPATRPTDNLALSIDQPQEEEFAIANTTHTSFYHFWMFPREIAFLRERYLLFNNTSAEDISDFCNATRRTIEIALHCSGKSRFLSKNPPHTARIPLLLKMFPDAKFIYIHRDSNRVLDSTRRFFRATTDAISLQHISTSQLNREIEKTYNALIGRYERDCRLIPAKNLCTISFEDFVDYPLCCTEHIYSTLRLGECSKVNQRIFENRYLGAKMR